eukprot:scaffold4180_cov36-Phaeocystis_antarctica.AAC.2
MYSPGALQGGGQGLARPSRRRGASSGRQGGWRVQPGVTGLRRGRGGRSGPAAAGGSRRLGDLRRRPAGRRRARSLVITPPETLQHARSTFPGYQPTTLLGALSTLRHAGVAFPGYHPSTPPGALETLRHARGVLLAPGTGVVIPEALELLSNPNANPNLNPNPNPNPSPDRVYVLPPTLPGARAALRPSLRARRGRAGENALLFYGPTTFTHQASHLACSRYVRNTAVPTHAPT